MRLILPLPGNETFARHLAEAGGWELGHLETRRFPDGESYVRILSDVADRPVALVCTLARPDDGFLPLAFAADTAKRRHWPKNVERSCGAKLAPLGESDGTDQLEILAAVKMALLIEMIVYG